MRRQLCCGLLLVIGVLTSVVQARTHHAAPLKSSTQVLVVTTLDWNAVEGGLQRYERSTRHKQWRAVGEPVTIVVGINGLGWGEGLVTKEELHIRSASDPVKKEGDGKAPAGIFRFSTAFGYAPQPQSGWRMPYLSLTKSVECVDDTNSKFYNQVVDHDQVAPDWNSSEHMLRLDELYRWGLVINHNASPSQPGGGSCIFMHIWLGPGRGTVGCTAMPPERLESILAWLDPAKKPLLVQLPVAQYQRLQKAWKLPILSQALKQRLRTTDVIQ